MKATIALAVHELVQSKPERPFIHFRDLPAQTPGEQYLGYGDLWQSACAFAAALEGLPHGSHVMLVMPLGLRLLAAHLGVQLCGSAASIFTHPSEKLRADVYSRNLKHAIATLRPEAIVTVRAFLEPVNEALERGSILVVTTEDVPLRADAPPRTWQAARPEDIAVIQYSSGSTGLQKCVALSNSMVVGQCESYGRFIGLDRDHDTICSWLPLYHDMGLFTAWLMPLVNGVRVSMIDPFEWVRQPGSLFQLITDVGGTLCWQPNFAFRLLVARLSGDALVGVDISTMRGFTNCSEPVSAQVMVDFETAFRNVGVSSAALWACYAMAENAFAVTHSGGPSEPPRFIYVDKERFAEGRAEQAPAGLPLTSCGVGIDGCHVRVVDEQRKELPEGCIGEIALKSPFMLREYIRSPELTRTAIDEQGWYHSGDLGFQLKGRLYVTGRKKELLIVGGRNFYPQDIEAIAGQCEGAVPGRAVALGIEDAVLGTQKIIVILESRFEDAAEQGLLAATVRKEIFEKLDCPVADVHVVPHMWLLKTSSGKIARRPNLDKYLKKEVAEEQVAHDASAGRISNLCKAGIAETVAWAFAIAFCIYFYALIFLLGDSKSWNVYANF